MAEPIRAQGGPADTLRMLLPGPAEIGRLGGGSTGDDEVVQALADLYAYPEPAGRRPWVRASMVSTLDGSAIGADGLSGQHRRARRPCRAGRPARAGRRRPGRGRDRSCRGLPGAEGQAGVRRAPGRGPGSGRRSNWRSSPAAEGFRPRRSRDQSGYVITCTAADVSGLQGRFGIDRVIVAGSRRRRDPCGPARVGRAGTHAGCCSRAGPACSVRRSPTTWSTSCA